MTALQLSLLDLFPRYWTGRPVCAVCGTPPHHHTEIGRLCSRIPVCDLPVAEARAATVAPTSDHTRMELMTHVLVLAGAIYVASVLTAHLAAPIDLDEEHTDVR